MPFRGPPPPATGSLTAGHPERARISDIDSHAHAAFPSRRLYLLRHGDVDYFDGVGRPLLADTVPLNAAGREQARALGGVLAECPLDRVVTSGLRRTQETAEAVAAGRGLAIETCAALREIQPGRLPVVSPARVREAFLAALPHAAAGPETRFLGGERFGDFFARVIPAFRELVGAPGWTGMLLVAHGGVNRALLLDVMGFDPRESLPPSFAALEQDPGALNIIDYDPRGRPMLRLVNYTPYAPAKIGLALPTMEVLLAQYETRLRAAPPAGAADESADGEPGGGER